MREPIFLRTAAGSRQSVSGSTSANTTRAPRAAAHVAVQTNVSGVVMTSSCGPIPKTIMQASRAVPQELKATACLAPSCSAKALWNSASSGIGKKLPWASVAA